MSIYNHGPRTEDQSLSRRQLLCRCGMGMGSLALANILAQTGLASPAPINPLSPKSPQFRGSAKRIIHLFMNGGPSQVDTFDPKPKLAEYAGKSLPVENLRTERKTGAAFPSPYKFEKYGQSGIEVSALFPNVGGCVDDLCFIHSMQADSNNHSTTFLPRERLSRERKRDPSCGIDDRLSRVGVLRGPMTVRQW